MYVRSGTTVVSLIHVSWRDYSWRQLELSLDFQSLPTQNICIEKLVGRDWKKEKKGESSNYSMISKNSSTAPYLLELIPLNNPKYDYLSPTKWQQYMCYIL